MAPTTSTGSSGRTCSEASDPRTATTTPADRSSPRSRFGGGSTRSANSCTSGATTPTVATAIRQYLRCAPTWTHAGPAGGTTRLIAEYAYRYFEAVARAPISPTEKWTCYRILLSHLEEKRIPPGDQPKRRPVVRIEPAGRRRATRPAIHHEELPRHDRNTVS